jgi:hypothetical protein
MNNSESITSHFKLLLFALVGAITLFLSASLLLSCKKDAEPVPAPIISSFSPASGTAPGGGLTGTLVTIVGSNFSTTAAENQVKFNGTATTTASATATQLTASVPQGATSGKITVTVNGQTATSATDFTVLLPPTVTSFSPAYAPPGATVTITGTNFSTTPANNVVTINSIAANVTAATTTQLSITVPTTATTGKIVVTTNALTSSSANDLEVLKDIPRNGLIAFYPFTNNFKEKGVNNPTLDFALATSLMPTFFQDRFGKAQQALNFDGTQSSVTSSPVVPGTPWTISYWLSFGPLSAGYMGCLSAKANSKGVSIEIYGPDANTFYFLTGGGTGISQPEYRLTNVSPSGYLPSAGTGTSWRHFVHTYNGAIYFLYQDGIVLEGVNTITSTPPGSQLEIGKSNGYFYTGKMDDIAVYNRALSATEVMQLSQATISKY